MKDQLYSHGASLCCKDSGKQSRKIRTFVAIQIPLLDLRSIARTDNLKLFRPVWPDPIPGKEFIRSVGVIKRRHAGPIDSFDGEISFCEANKLVKFKGNLDSKNFNIRVVYRRLFGFEYGYRFEFGLEIYSFDLVHWQELCDEILDFPVVVDGYQPTKIRDSGNNIASHLARLTSKTSGTVSRPWSGLYSGIPAVRIESSGIAKIFETSTSKNVVPCYLLIGFAKSNRDLRSALWRLHTQLELLRCLNRLLRQNPEGIDLMKATDLISELTQYLAHERRDGFNQPVLVALAMELGQIELRDLTSLANAISHQSLGLARKLQITAERAEREKSKIGATDSTVQVGLRDIILINKPKLEMVMGNKVKAGKNSIINIDSDISESFNRIALKDADLHQALKQIITKVDLIEDSQVREEAKELAVTMVGAADSGKRSLFIASWERLQKIAPVVVSGVAIVTAVTRFLGLS